MYKALLNCVGIALSGMISLQVAQPQQSADSAQAAAQFRKVLDRYCVTCHNEKLKTAGLMLDKADVGNVPAGAEVWEKVIRKLRTSAMPPAGMPRPDQATYDSFATYLETAVDSAAAANPNPGRPSIHRLNRAEYANAIRDLLAVEIDVGSLLPADDSGYGFDNMADVLSISPMLLDRYMSAAGKIGSLAIENAASRPAIETYDLPGYLLQDGRMSEDLPLGSRGGIAIRHFFPLDGEYVLKILLQTGNGDAVRGLAEPHQLEVRLDGARIKLFTFGGEHKGGLEKLEGKSPERSTDAGQLANGSMEVRFAAKAGDRLVGVDFLDETSVPEGVLRPATAGYQVRTKPIEEGNPAVGSVSIGGPYNVAGTGETASRRRIFVCRPTGSADEEACAKRILSTLARRAYRRPVTDRDLSGPLTSYKTGRSAGGFESGIRMALEGMLASPKFLFRVERDPPNADPNSAYRISDLELASRLSFFLWSSIPDDQLLDLAARGKLRDPAVLEQQVRRMLGDARSKALVSNFAGQWLLLRNVRSASPDEWTFPDFDENLRDALEKETDLFLESMLREDRPLMQLLSANFTFVNERLARYYGIPNVYGSRFQRVTLSDDNRRGLLGQGSILLVTSYPNRTSPVLRGKWVLETILGTPPPPPPANVPSLKDNGENGKILSMRQRMEQHRANPVCASCHSRMDPLGFALENFDGIGRWRTSTEANTPVDSSGVLPDGTKFQGAAELRNILLSKPQQFVTTLTEKLLTYALGRDVEYYDEPAVREIMRKAAPSDYRWSSLILGIVNSPPFQSRRSQSQ